MIHAALFHRVDQRMIDGLVANAVGQAIEPHIDQRLCIIEVEDVSGYFQVIRVCVFDDGLGLIVADKSCVFQFITSAFGPRLTVVYAVMSSDSC